MLVVAGGNFFDIVKSARQQKKITYMSGAHREPSYNINLENIQKQAAAAEAVAGARAASDKGGTEKLAM